MAVAVGLLALPLAPAGPASSEPLPTIEISTPRVLEGNPGPSTVPQGAPTLMTFTATLSAVPTQPASILWATLPRSFVPGPAIWQDGDGFHVAPEWPFPDDDFVGSQGVLAWAPGDSPSKKFTVPVLADTSVELDDGDNSWSGDVGGVHVNLYQPVNISLPCCATGIEGWGVIVNDDTGPTFAITPTDVCEGPSGTTVPMAFDVRLTDLPAGFASAVTVDWSVAHSEDGVPLLVGAAESATTPTSGDYVKSSGTLAWDADPLTPVPGLGTSQRVTVTVNGDDAVEGNEIIVLALSKPHNSGTGPGGTAAVGLIKDDDGRACT